MILFNFMRYIYILTSSVFVYVKFVFFGEGAENKMIQTLIVVCLLTLIIHASETLSYAVRFAGVKSGKIAVALSLSGIIVLTSRTANLIQGPLTAGFVDHAKRDAGFHLITYFRTILLASSLGTCLAIVLFPTFVNLFSRLIVHLEVAGSIPKLLSCVTIGKIKHVKHYFKNPTLSMLRSLRILDIPKRFILLNIIVTAFYTVGVIASLYAAHLDPENSTAASQASGLINGLATILLTIFIDPQLGLITDKALHHPKEQTRLGKIYGVLMISRLAGTLLGQLFLVPAAYWIQLVVNVF